MNTQIQSIENTLNNEFVALKNSIWEIRHEGNVSVELIEKLKRWMNDGADTEEDFVDEYHHEKAVIEDEHARITVLLTHEDSRITCDEDDEDEDEDEDEDVEDTVTTIGLEDLKDFEHEEYDLVMLRATFKNKNRPSKKELIESVKRIINLTIEQKEDYQSEDESEIDYDDNQKNHWTSFLLLKKQ